MYIEDISSLWCDAGASLGALASARAVYLIFSNAFERYAPLERDTLLEIMV